MKSLENYQALLLMLITVFLFSGGGYFGCSSIKTV